jgi:glucose/arabinose dehydrogenase
MNTRVLFALAVVASVLLLAPACGGGVEKGEELIDKRRGHSLPLEVVEPNERLMEWLELPKGFEIGVFAEGLGGPRMLEVDEDGTVYVTRPGSGDVLALEDRDGDGRADEIKPLVDGLPGVHGIALRGDEMYLCTVRELLALKKGEDGNYSDPRRILDDLPPGGRHPKRTLGFDSQGRLYITIGSTCNCCLEENPENAAIIRVRPDGSERTLFAQGLRNTIGFGRHPETGEMWGMDHGTDWLGDDFPPEELNRLENGKHYGWPFVYAKGKVIELEQYPEGFGRERWLERTEPAVLGYRAHSAPIQMAFYTGAQFPEEYRGDAFVAMHGSWNRRPPAGYELVRIRFENGRPVEFEPFLTGFLYENAGRYSTFGRPAGIAVAADGSLLVGCDRTGVIYRIWYGG